MEEQKKPFRRRRRFQGADWTPLSQPALPPDGAWCRACKTRHGYMTMGFATEKRKRCWVILWSCKKTGNVIEEMELGGQKDLSTDSGPDTDCGGLVQEG